MIDLEPVLADVCRRTPRGTAEPSSDELAIYRRILLRAGASAESLADLSHQDARATLGAVLVSVGACLAKEERPEDALVWLERADRFVDALGAADRYRQQLARGDALGQLGRVSDMDAALSAARDVATYELGDLDAAETAWHLLLLHASRGESWGYLARVTDAALLFADRTGDSWLEQRVARMLSRDDRVSGFEDDTRRRPAPAMLAAKRA